MKNFQRIVAVAAALILSLPFGAGATSFRSDAHPVVSDSLSAESQSVTPNGLWITANHDAIIQIASCGSRLCGRIVGMFLGRSDPTPKDWVGNSQCRLTIIQAAPQVDADGQPYWAGSIINPRNGGAYHAIVRLDSRNNLLLRGYVGLPIFGKTETWTPYRGMLAENCRLSESVD